MKRKKTFSQEELRYLKLLAQQYPTVQAASSEIDAILWKKLEELLFRENRLNNFLSPTPKQHARSIMLRA